MIANVYRRPLIDSVTLTTLDPSTKSLVKTESEKEELFTLQLLNVANEQIRRRALMTMMLQLSIAVSYQLRLARNSTLLDQPESRIREEIRNYLRSESDDDPLAFWRQGL